MNCTGEYSDNLVQDKTITHAGIVYITKTHQDVKHQL